MSAITFSVITGIQSPNEEQWQPMLESMNHTVKEYIKFDGKICTSGKIYIIIQEGLSWS